MKNKEYLGETGSKRLESRLQEFLESEDSGFIFIYTGHDHKITDAYRGICADHVLDSIERSLISADALGLLAECGSDQPRQ